MRSQDCRYQHRLLGVSLLPAPQAYGPSPAPAALPTRHPLKGYALINGPQRGQAYAPRGGGLPSPWPACSRPSDPLEGASAPSHRCAAVLPPKYSRPRGRQSCLDRAGAFWKIPLQRQRPRPSRTIVLLTGDGQNEGSAPRILEVVPVARIAGRTMEKGRGLRVACRPFVFSHTWPSWHERSQTSCFYTPIPGLTLLN